MKILETRNRPQQRTVRSPLPTCHAILSPGAPVSPDYGPRGNAFNGSVRGVQIAIAEAAESVDHLVKPEDAIRIALSRQ